ncbi:protein fem-1 homolog A-A isoform X3 [Plutella xylostella]|uniref:protein fem-1 homolog A-A isoform X3 n=1 Tax=Plutella xylostella TaxID=51655 RepID=UPI0020330E03|nr:protein fem-1 homolog A-A isoform X3 [Plutella xylostella]
MMSEEEDMESGSPTEAGPARALVEKGRAARRRLDAVFNELMQECRHSAPGARLSARLRNTLERMPPALRRAVVSRTAAGCAPLFVCARRGNAELAEYLVHVCDAPLEQRGVYDAPDERAAHQVTPLWCAAVAGRLGVLRVLADAGADLDAGSDSGSTPVRSACFMTHESIVRELVERGANIHKPNHNGGTCLINSVQSTRLCAYLLSKGAQVDACDLQLKTALHYAAQEHRADTARLLLAHGADPARRSRAGDDALRTAALKGAASIVTLLTSRGRYSVDALADAYELLGATQLDELNEIGSALANWRHATALRHTESGYIPKRGHQVLGGGDVTAGATEWTTHEQLDALSADVEALRVQALLVAARILGPHHKDTVFRLMYRGASYADAFRYQNCIDLWTWALEIRIERDTLLYTDTWHCACALTRLMLDARGGRLERARGVPSLRHAARLFARTSRTLPEARKALDVRPVFKKQAETFDRALRCVTHLIYLMLDIASTPEEIVEVKTQIRELVAADIRSAQTGDTLLHLCVSRLNVIRSTYFADEMNAPPIFPECAWCVPSRSSARARARATRRGPRRCTWRPYRITIVLSR